MNKTFIIFSILLLGSLTTSGFATNAFQAAEYLARKGLIKCEQVPVGVGENGLVRNVNTCDFLLKRLHHGNNKPNGYLNERVNRWKISVRRLFNLLKGNF